MKTKEEILQEMNLPELFWEYDMQNEVMIAMEEYAQRQLKNCNLQNVSGSLPTSEELQEIVVKIAYSQQGEEQADDCYAKMGMLHEFISKYVNGNDR